MTMFDTDMEWITGVGSNEVDIGYVPLMQIFSLSSSVPWDSDSDKSFNFNEVKFNESAMAWDQEMTRGDVVKEIERTMYPFKKVRIILIPHK